MTVLMTLGEKLEIFRKVQANPDISTYKWTRICAYDKDSNNNDSMTTQDLDLTEGVKIIYSENPSKTFKPFNNLNYARAGQSELYNSSMSKSCSTCGPVDHLIGLTWKNLKHGDIGCSEYRFLLKLTVENSLGVQAYYHDLYVSGKLLSMFSLYRHHVSAD